MPEIACLFIPADINQPVEERKVDPTSLDAYRKVVGGSIEHINLYRPDGSAYFNEEGKLLGLPVNQRATAIVWVHNSAFRGFDAIVGDVLITGPLKNAADTDVDDELVTLLFKTEHFAVEVQTVGDPKWYGNQAVYDDWYTAYVEGISLAERWMSVEEVRIVPAAKAA